MGRTAHPVGGDRAMVDRVQDGFSKGKKGRRSIRIPRFKIPDQRKCGKRSAKDRERGGIARKKNHAETIFCSSTKRLETD